MYAGEGVKRSTNPMEASFQIQNNTQKKIKMLIYQEVS
jgi:hypothetical protein